MRYFTIYVTPGGRLSVRSNKEEKYAFQAFANLTAPNNPRHSPPIWAICVKVRPNEAEPDNARICKVFGYLP